MTPLSEGLQYKMYIEDPESVNGALSKGENAQRIRLEASCSFEFAIWLGVWIPFCLCFRF